MLGGSLRPWRRSADWPSGGKADNNAQARNNAQPAQTAGFDTSMHILSSRLFRAIPEGGAPVRLALHA